VRAMHTEADFCFAHLMKRYKGKTVARRRSFRPRVTRRISGTLSSSVRKFSRVDDDVQVGGSKFEVGSRATAASLSFRRLLNFYGSILVNPAKWPEVKFKEAKLWHQWLTSRAGLDAITSYRIDGEELFFPPRPRL
jgi:hypothetical protein